MSVTVVYRSAADLKKAEFWYEEGPKMQERAIKAEAENERYKLMIKSITGGLDEAIETVHFLEAEVERLKTENARLRKVAEAARDGNTFALIQALAELDEEEGEICNTHLRKPCFSE